MSSRRKELSVAHTDSPPLSGIRTRFHDLGVWERDGVRAPYKPLLLLYALGRYALGSSRLIGYAEMDAELGRLFREFGPPREKYSTVYPFWYLRNDGVWEVPGGEAARVREGKSSEPTKTWLRENRIAGGLTQDLFDALKSDPTLLRGVAQDLLDAHFPRTLHADILQAVGLPSGVEVFAGPRDPAFRRDVLRAYRRRCAVCSFDARLGDALVGVEAAHIRWHQAGGPPRVSNGLVLCSLHHKLFDRGAFTVDHDRRVVVSEELSGSAVTEAWMTRFHGAAIHSPSASAQRPDPAFLAWHRREVFREPALML